MFAASSEYIAKKIDGTTMILTIDIENPELDPLSNYGDYRCKIEILALSFYEYSYGVDAVQSLCLAIEYLKYTLAPLTLASWQLYLPNDLEHEVDMMSVLFPVPFNTNLKISI